MQKFDPLEAWIDNVAVSHSNSNGTRQSYKSNFQRFCEFISKTPTQILNEYERSNDREFRRKYAQYIRAYNSLLLNEGFSPNTIGSRIAAIKSFFKYNDLPLGHVPAVRLRIVYHNRDITRKEIKLILDASKPRERAFYAIMAQSGLRPDTICNLRYRDVKEDFIQNRIPCKIDIPQESAKGKYQSYFTFIGEEAVRHLKSYLIIRPKIADDKYLFVKQGKRQKTSPKSISNMFARTVRKLQAKGLIQIHQKKKNTPRDIRLYNLRKWFRKQAHQAGFELVQFWMGHVVKAGLDEHYRPKDVEFHRKLYAEKAMPFLRFETATPTETEKTIEELKKQLTERDKEINAMKETIVKIQPIIEFVNSFNQPQQLKELLDFLKDDYAADPKLRPIETEFSPYIESKLNRIAKRKGITKKEALEQLVTEDLELLEKSEERRLKIAKAHGLPITKEDYERKKKKRRTHFK